MDRRPRLFAFRVLVLQLTKDTKVIQGLILLSFFSIVVLLRLPSFPRVVIDWDESLYLLMARGLINGQVPYTSVWDHKPPGIYVLFALSQIVFGPSVAAIRISACIAVSTSCFLLYRFGKRVFANSKLGILAALLYAAFSLKNGGLASNTEIFFTPLVILGLYLICTRTGFATRLNRIGCLTLTMIGFLLGLSLQINYITVFHLVAGLLLVAAKIYNERKEHFLTHAFICDSLILLGALFPFGVVFLYFWITGYFEEYFHANFIANLIHSRAASFSLSLFLSVMASQVKGHLILWCSLFLVPFFLAIFRKTYPRCLGDLGILGTWLAFGLVGVSFTKAFYAHYFLALLPSLCLITSYIIINGLRLRQVFERERRKYILLSVIVLVLISSFFYHPYNAVKSRLKALWIDKRCETVGLIVSHIRGRIGDDSYIYVVDYEPILYYLLEAKHPTPYLFPAFLISEHFSRVAGIEPIRELDSIMSLRPQYVIMKEKEHLSPFFLSPFFAKLDVYLEKQYIKETTIRGILVYRILTPDK